MGQGREAAKSFLKDNETTRLEIASKVKAQVLCSKEDITEEKKLQKEEITS